MENSCNPKIPRRDAVQRSVHFGNFGRHWWGPCPPTRERRSERLGIVRDRCRDHRRVQGDHQICTLIATTAPLMLARRLRALHSTSRGGAAAGGAAMRTRGTRRRERERAGENLPTDSRANLRRNHTDAGAPILAAALAMAQTLHELLSVTRRRQRDLFRWRRGGLFREHERQRSGRPASRSSMPPACDSKTCCANATAVMMIAGFSRNGARSCGQALRTLRWARHLRAV